MICSVLSFVSILAFIEVSSQPVKTREQLLDIAREESPCYQDLFVFYNFQLESIGAEVDSSKLVNTTDCKLWRSDTKYRRDLVQGGETAGGSPRSLTYMTMYDGIHLHSLNHSGRSYTIRLTDSPERSATIGDAFLDFHLRNPGLEGLGGLSGQSLISLLSSPSIVVRPDTEFINGRECHVVDIPLSENVLQGTVWLDAGAGCLPIKQDFYSTVSDINIQYVYLRFEVTKVQPVGSCWMIQEGLKVVDPGTKTETQYRYTLDLSGGEPTMGTSIQDAVFVPEVPSGYLCKDFSLDKSWVQP
jgi:hypothetical protein